MTTRSRFARNASPTRRSLSPCVYMSAVSKKFIPWSKACRSRPMTSARVPPENRPPILAHPKPISDVVRSVLPNRRYRMRALVTPPQRVVPQVVCQAIGCARREGHRGQRWIFLDRGSETAGVDNRHVVHIVQPIPAIDDAEFRRGVHPCGTGVVGGRPWYKFVYRTVDAHAEAGVFQDGTQPGVRRGHRLGHMGTIADVDVKYRHAKSITFIRMQPNIIFGLRQHCRERHQPEAIRLCPGER